MLLPCLIIENYLINTIKIHPVNNAAYVYIGIVYLNLPEQRLNEVVAFGVFPILMDIVDYDFRMFCELRVLRGFVYGVLNFRSCGTISLVHNLVYLRATLHRRVLLDYDDVVYVQKFIGIWALLVCKAFTFAEFH